MAEGLKVSRINYKKLLKAPCGLIILRLAMAFNDLSSVNEFTKRLQKEMPPTRGLRRSLQDADVPYNLKEQDALQGHIRYLQRMNVGHLAEANKIISDVNKCDELKVVINTLAEKEKKLWDEMLERFYDPRFRNYVARIRSSVAFPNRNAQCPCYHTVRNRVRENQTHVFWVCPYDDL